MYTPEHFSVRDDDRAYSLIESHPFGMLVCSPGDGPPEIAHIPFLVDRAARALRGHVARANPIAALVARGAPVVAVFSGPHAYVSPSWYERPRSNVPTWNYAAVHASGAARRVEPREDVLRELGRLSAHFEAPSSSPWSVSEADAAYVDRLVGAITSFEMAIDRLDVTFKMSQNRSPSDRARVSAGLRARGAPGDDAVASLVDELGQVAPRERPPGARQRAGVDPGRGGCDDSGPA